MKNHLSVNKFVPTVSTSTFSSTALVLEKGSRESMDSKELIIQNLTELGINDSFDSVNFNEKDHGIVSCNFFIERNEFTGASDGIENSILNKFSDKYYVFFVLDTSQFFIDVTMINKSIGDQYFNESTLLINLLKSHYNLTLKNYLHIGGELSEINSLENELEKLTVMYQKDNHGMILSSQFINHYEKIEGIMDLISGILEINWIWSDNDSMTDEVCLERLDGDSEEILEEITGLFFQYQKRMKRVKQLGNILENAFPIEKTIETLLNKIYANSTKKREFSLFFVLVTIKK